MKEKALEKLFTFGRRKEIFLNEILLHLHRRDLSIEEGREIPRKDWENLVACLDVCVFFFSFIDFGRELGGRVGRRRL